MSADRYYLSERAARRTAEAVRKVLGSGVAGENTPPRRRGRDYRKAWYRIVSRTGPGVYTCRLQAWDAAAGELADVTDSENPEYGLNQTAYDWLGRDNVAVDQLVQGWKIWVDDEWVLLVDFGLPGGSGQYKVLQLDEDDVPVWDWVRGHE